MNVKALFLRTEPGPTLWYDTHPGGEWVDFFVIHLASRCLKQKNIKSTILSIMKKYVYLFATTLLTAMSLSLAACGGSDSSSDNTDSSYYSDDADDEGSYHAVEFNSTYDVSSYLNSKTFRADDGTTIRFYNNARSVDMNGVNIANDVNISGVGINSEGVAYATVRISNPAGITTTMQLLAVQERAELLDPNDGTTYVYGD